ncbi:Vacuolar-processing enzyme gamma-isozyme [Prunus dulcis]|uniref:Vacuolar-processing enzyme gamma-isozyme n=1 Tax=Prunus dulcis TaxID=3755 RepID=A0A4Y1R3K6_PRUDU|nr:Vacuolar-processing enzyme gamma-isozyme [Prunus dulcis]
MYITLYNLHCRMARQSCGALIFLACLSLTAGSLCLPVNAVHIDSITHGDDGSPSTTQDNGKKWAVLVARSNGYRNYRHQANVCHAYQILKKGGLKDENIIVFMYDDIAFNPENPRQGVIINKPKGHDVYKGVPKDYTGDDVNADNLYAVILGNKSTLSGGSGKVLRSVQMTIFSYITLTMVLQDYLMLLYLHSEMPTGTPSVFAIDLIDVLNKKHAAKGYKGMVGISTSSVFYLEACESGSIFEGLLPKNVSIYATTSANAEEDGYATYCPGQPGIPAEYDICLGDLFSISWMEDWTKMMRKETLEKQYERYGDMSHRKEFLLTYMGADPANDSYTSMEDISSPSISRVVSQLPQSSCWLSYQTGSPKARKQLLDEIAHRKLVDYRINKIWELLFGHQKSSKVLLNVRPQGQPLVDDWDCFKMLMRTYENNCGPLSNYGMKYVRAIANMGNAGVTIENMAAVSDQTCSKKPDV